MAPSNTALVASHAFFLKTTYAEYPAHSALYTSLPVTVSTSGCDCSLLTWDNPSAAAITIQVGAGSASTQAIPEATVNAASKGSSASQQI